MPKIMYEGQEFASSTNTVKQTEITTNADYEVLLSGTADSTTRTEGANKSARITANPSKGQLSTLYSDGSSPASIVGSGAVTLYSDNATPTKSMVSIYSGNPTNSEGGNMHIYTANSAPAVSINGDTNGNGAVYVKHEGAPRIDEYVDGTTGSSIIKLYNGSTQNTITLNADSGNISATSLNGATIGSSPVFTDTTYTFANGTNGFTVTPAGGTAQTVTVTPSITDNVTGSGTSGYIAKFNGTNTITNGPAFGSSTTTFLRNDGQFATPNYPSVGNGTITLQRNGTTVGSFTTNQSGNSTINFSSLMTSGSATAQEFNDGLYQNMAYTGNLNNISCTSFGVVSGTGMTNAPDTAYWYVLCLPINGNVKYMIQVAFRVTSSLIRLRYCTNGTWSNWVALH